MRNTYLALANEYSKLGHKSNGEERKDFFDKARQIMNEYNITVEELGKCESKGGKQSAF